MTSILTSTNVGFMAAATVVSNAFVKVVALPRDFDTNKHSEGSFLVIITFVLLWVGTLATVFLSSIAGEGFWKRKKVSASPPVEVDLVVAKQQMEEYINEIIPTIFSSSGDASSVQ